jgi:hypothetical protein
LIVWWRVSGNDAVIPMRELCCRVAGFSTPSRLVRPPYQKLPSRETHSRGLKS